MGFDLLVMSTNIDRTIWIIDQVLKLLALPFLEYCYNIQEKMKVHGGKRTGAGRPRGTNQYGEPTKPVRIPLSKVDRVLRFVREREDELPSMVTQFPQGFRLRQMITPKELWT